jgi:transitional endoplasmic reticulum ATPase
LKKGDILQIVDNALAGIPLAADLDVDRIVEAAKGVCNTPADYAAFVEKARSLRNTEFEVIMRIRQIRHDPQKARENFIKFNFKTLIGILEAYDRKNQLKTTVRGAPEQFLEHYEAILNCWNPSKSRKTIPWSPAISSQHAMKFGKSHQKGQGGAR